MTTGSSLHDNNNHFFFIMRMLFQLDLSTYIVVFSRIHILKSSPFMPSCKTTSNLFSMWLCFISCLHSIIQNLFTKEKTAKQMTVSR